MFTNNIVQDDEANDLNLLNYRDGSVNPDDLKSMNCIIDGDMADDQNELSIQEWDNVIKMIFDHKVELTHIALQAGSTAYFFKHIVTLQKAGLLNKLENFIISALETDSESENDALTKEAFLTIVEVLTKCSKVTWFHYCYSSDHDILVAVMEWVGNKNCRLERLSLTNFIIDEEIFETILLPNILKNPHLKDLEFTEDSGKFTFTVEQLKALKDLRPDLQISYGKHVNGEQMIVYNGDVVEGNSIQEIDDDSQQSNSEDESDSSPLNDFNQPNKRPKLNTFTDTCGANPQKALQNFADCFKNILQMDSATWLDDMYAKLKIAFDYYQQQSQNNIKNSVMAMQRDIVGMLKLSKDELDQAVKTINASNLSPQMKQLLMLFLNVAPKPTNAPASRAV